ncbi:MAG TPA: protein translocase subunit SecD [Gammaproteobacteria bacterium]|nr:protein translocase subunit SecD [Gammaproteobacteria bacterium]
MNKYPLWKQLLIAFVLLIGVIYALPNLYGDDPALQISSSRGAEVNSATEGRVRVVLQEAGVPVKGTELAAGRLLVRFNNTEDQLKAQGLVKRELGDDYFVALNLAPTTPSWLRAINALPMYLGLDLRGGVHFLMEVDMEAVTDQTLERYVGDFRAALREEKLRYLSVRREGEKLEVKFRSREERDAARVVLRKAFPELVLSEADEDGAFLVRAVMSEKEQQEARNFAVQQNITALRNRVNELGVAEPVIQRQGQNRIVVQLPGVQDTARAKEILGATATLEFRMVDEKHEAAAAAAGRVPAGSRLYRTRQGQPVLLQRRVIITGDSITDAAATIDQRDGSPAVSITLDGKGARSMHNVSRENVGKLMAVVFIETKTETRWEGDKPVKVKKKVEEVINQAVIREALGKRFQITGLDSPDEARDLALLLRAGALAAPVDIVEERTVGPSLGQDNIDQGRMAVIVGFLVVVVFMAVYYRIFGVVAGVALVFNLILIIAVLSMLQATLTLPGIAGIVLTVGMAVDANVLIFERIREEIRAGNSPQASIHSGYQRALSTIADANITTLIAAAILFMFGTGPIKGFAVTLCIGIITSMFTAIMVSRAMINLIYGGKRVARLAI